MHYWNAATTISCLRDALLVQLPSSELTDDGWEFNGTTRASLLETGGSGGDRHADVLGRGMPGFVFEEHQVAIAVLRQRAARAHQSLQEYLRSRLIEEAAMPTLEEVLERAGTRSGGSVSSSAAVKAIRSDRDRR